MVAVLLRDAPMQQMHALPGLRCFPIWATDIFAPARLTRTGGIRLAKLLEVMHLKKYFPLEQRGILQRINGYVKAVDDISFSIEKSMTLGIVGESGCGKSTAGRTILRLYEPTDGTIIFDGVDITRLTKQDMRLYRKRMQIIFQDPLSSLDPRWKIRKLLTEPLDVFRNDLSKAEKSEKIQSLLDIVGLPGFHAERYPHEFSGGQRQRIGIARALTLDPEFLVCDEPVSALDVSIQSQVLNLLLDIQQRLDLTYLFISHDLSVVRFISDRIGVMYLGKLVEMADAEEIFSHSAHPYTNALMKALPIPNPKKKRGYAPLQGEVPNPANPPDGCHFHGRCPQCMEVCKEQVPEWNEVSPGHFVTCHLFS